MGLRDRIRRRIEEVKREVAQGIAEGLKDQPEALAELEKAGLLDAGSLAALAEGRNLSEVITEFKDGILALIAEQPSAMATLDVRPLEILTVESESVQPDPESGDSLTIVFSDLEGFTRFNSMKGDKEATALLRDHYDTVEALVRSRGGTVVKRIGDGHMMSFPAPAAGVMAGLDLIRAAPEPLAVRVGGHAGPVARVGDDLLGHAVNVAARVTDLADGGQEMVTAEVRSLIGRLPGVVFGDLRTVELKGVEEPIEVCSAHPA